MLQDEAIGSLVYPRIYQVFFKRSRASKIAILLSS